VSGSGGWFFALNAAAPGTKPASARAAFIISVTREELSLSAGGFAASAASIAAQTSCALGSIGDFETIIQGEVDGESARERWSSQYSQVVGELQGEKLRRVSLVEVMTDIRELDLGILLDVWS
jgi:hypothetical protein